MAPAPNKTQAMTPIPAEADINSEAGDWNKHRNNAFTEAKASCNIFTVYNELLTTSVKELVCIITLLLNSKVYGYTS